MTTAKRMKRLESNKMPFKFEDEVSEGDFENEEDGVGVEADDEGDNDRDEEEDLFDLLDEEDHMTLLEDTLAVCTTLNKVYSFISSILTL